MKFINLSFVFGKFLTWRNFYNKLSFTLISEKHDFIKVIRKWPKVNTNWQKSRADALNIFYRQAFFEKRTNVAWFAVRSGYFVNLKIPPDSSRFLPIPFFELHLTCERYTFTWFSFLINSIRNVRFCKKWLWCCLKFFLFILFLLAKSFCPVSFSMFSWRHSRCRG